MRRPIFNVRDFGAIGDGRENDTAAIQRAIDAAGEIGRGTVFFPDGVYSVHRAAADNGHPYCLQLKSNIDYRGAGANSKLMLAPEQPNSTRLMSTQFVREPHDIRILDLQLDGNRWNQNLSYEQLHGILLVGVKAGQVENCIIHDFVGDGVYAHQGDTGSEAIYVAGNEFYGINRAAINFQGTSNSTAERNYLHDCWGHPIKMELANPLNLHGNSFVNNRAIKTAGMSISGNGDSQLNEMTIRGNYFEDTTGEFAITLRLVNRRFRVEENIIVRPEQIGIEVVSAQGEIIIARNTIQQAGTLSRMFVVGSATALPPGLKDHDRGAITLSSVEGFVIEKNYILNSFLQGIMLNGCQNTGGINFVKLNLITGTVESPYTVHQPDFPAGLWLKNTANTDVLLNEIWQNAGVGILLSLGSADNKFRCNQIESNRGGGVLVKVDAGANNDFGICSINPGNNTFRFQNESYGTWAVKNERPGATNQLPAQGNYWHPTEFTEGEIDRSNSLSERPSAETCPGMP